MRLPSTLTRAMQDHLGITYFEQVWNAPNDHGRVNFGLSKAAKYVQTGAIVGASVVGLPTTDTVYAVYRVSADAFGRFVSFPSYRWITDHTILTEQKTQLTLYTKGGRLIPQGVTYCYFDPLNNSVLLAVRRLYTFVCTGVSYPELFVSVYHDTSRVTPISTSLFVVTSTSIENDVTAALHEAKVNYPGSCLISINGWTYAPDNYPIPTINDIVQLTIDPDIVGYCEVDVDDNVSGYFSERYKEYREILHIPKVLNPNNVTITIDTLTAIVFDPVTGKGVYGHQVYDHALESITHNDFSISRTILTDFQNTLSAQTIGVRLYARFPTEPQTLTDEVNHLSDLYALSDEEIKLQLAGLSTDQITAWKAVNLEQSHYLDFLYTFDQLGSSDLLSRYVSAMGYYSICSTLAESMHYYTYKGGEVQLAKPARLIGYSCQIMAYKNGLKIPDIHVEIKNYHDHITIGFSSAAALAVSDRIGIYIAEDNTSLPIAYDPTVASPAITVAHDDYVLVELITYNKPRAIIGGEVTLGYRVVNVSPGDYRITLNNDGSASFKVSTIHYGKHFYLIPMGTMTTFDVDLDPYLHDSKALIYPLQTRRADLGLMPIVSPGVTEAYINGHRLIEQVDYTIEPVEGDEGDILGRSIVITNQEYIDLDTGGNLLEIVHHSAINSSIDKGYAISNLLHRQFPPMIWTPSCGRTFVRGKLIEHVAENGTTLVSSDTLVDGSPYLLDYTTPYSVLKLMENIDSFDDETLRTRIYRVLNNTPTTYPSLVTITDQYTLYSPYLAQIAHDVANGSYTIIDEPKDDAFLQQFKRYALVKERDCILQLQNPLLDRRFVTLAAHYVNLTVSDPEQMKLMQRLVNLTLLPAQLNIAEVLV